MDFLEVLGWQAALAFIYYQLGRSDGRKRAIKTFLEGVRIRGQVPDDTPRETVSLIVVVAGFIADMDHENCLHWWAGPWERAAAWVQRWVL